MLISVDLPLPDLPMILERGKAARGALVGFHHPMQIDQVGIAVAVAPVRRSIRLAVALQPAFKHSSSPMTN
jgi:hypothetical protein